jgi:uncharacterized protein YgfB (UPF0149 family)
MLDFDSVQAALEGLGANLDAAEAHGTLCALLLEDADFPGWLGHCLDDLPDAEDVLAGERLTVLESLYLLTREQLGSGELGLEILLPDEDDDFGLRLLGLSNWCQGYLYGFGVLAAHPQAALDAEARECLSDLLEISKLSHDEDASEDAQLQFVELVEHVRIVALMLNESLNPPATEPTLH